MLSYKADDIFVMLPIFVIHLLYHISYNMEWNSFRSGSKGDVKAILSFLTLNSHSLFFIQHLSIPHLHTHSNGPYL